MKNIVSIALLSGIFAACGATPNNSSVTLDTNSNYTFSKDLRPVDGRYTAVEIKSSEENTFNIEKTTKFFDRLNGNEVVKQETVAMSLKCPALQSPINSEISEIYCSADSRWVDGPLTEVSFTKDSNGTFTVTKKITSYSWVTRKVNVNTTIIAEDLKFIR